MASLIALLLPGAVFCCLMAMEWWETGAGPTFIVYRRRLPVPLVYTVVFLAGWLFVILWLHQRITERS